MSIITQIIDAAMHPLVDPTGWHGLAYGLVTKKLLDTLKMVKNGILDARNKQTSDSDTEDSSETETLK